MTFTSTSLISRTTSRWSWTSFPASPTRTGSRKRSVVTPIWFIAISGCSTTHFRSLSATYSRWWLCREWWSIGSPGISSRHSSSGMFFSPSSPLPAPFAVCPNFSLSSSRKAFNSHTLNRRTIMWVPSHSLPILVFRYEWLTVFLPVRASNRSDSILDTFNCRTIVSEQLNDSFTVQCQKLFLSSIY